MVTKKLWLAQASEIVSLSGEAIVVGVAESMAARATLVRTTNGAMDLQNLSSLLRRLPPRQEKVIGLYFGLGCRRAHT